VNNKYTTYKRYIFGISIKIAGLMTPTYNLREPECTNMQTIVQLYGDGGKTIIRISNVEFKTYLPEACTNC
jgi:predicted nucleic acid-binding Zn ribbon protein